MNTSHRSPQRRLPERKTTGINPFLRVDENRPASLFCTKRFHTRGQMASPDAKTRDYTARYTDYYPLIASVVYSRIKDPETTHDLCQEIFLRYYTKFEEVENHRAWLLGTANFVLLEHYKKRKADHVDIEDVEESLEDAHPSAAGETKLILQEALSDPENFGDEKSRVLFDLIAVHDYTFTEAAKNLGITVPQARYRFNAVAGRIISYFRSRGIRGMEELL